MKSLRNRLHMAAAGLAVALGALSHYSSRQWWVEDDEGAYLLTSLLVSKGQALYKDVLSTKPPALFWLGAALQRIDPYGFLLPRAFAAVFAAGSIYVFFKLLLLWTDERRLPSWIALCGAVLFALAPLTFSAGKFFRPEAPLLFFTTLAVFLIAKWLVTDERRFIWSGGIAAGVALLFSLKSILPLSGVLVTLSWKAPRERRRTILSAAALALCAFSLPLLYYLVRGAPLWELWISHHLKQGGNASWGEILAKNGNYLAGLALTYPLLLPAAVAGAVYAVRRGTLLECLLCVPTLLLSLLLFPSRELYERHLLGLLPFLVAGFLYLAVTVSQNAKWNLSQVIPLWILAAIASGNFPPLMNFSVQDTGTYAVVAKVKTLSSAQAPIFGDYPEFALHAHRPTPALGSWLSAGSASNGQIEASQLIQAIEKDGVQLVLFHARGGTQFLYGRETLHGESGHLRQLRDFDAFCSFLTDEFEKLEEVDRMGQQIEIWKRRSVDHETP